MTSSKEAIRSWPISAPSALPASDVDRDAEGRGRVIQHVLSRASVIGIVGRVSCCHDMVIAAACGDRVASCAIRNGVVSGPAFKCVIALRRPLMADGRRSCN